MKISGPLVDILIKLAPHEYQGYVVYKNGKRVLYVQVIKAIYGILIAALLWYKKLWSDLEEVGFEFNPYDPCIANCTINGKQHTIRMHRDNIMSSHEDKEINDDFAIWLEVTYGSNKGHMKVL